MIRLELSSKLNLCAGIGMSMLLINVQSLIAQPSEAGCCAFIQTATHDTMTFDFSYDLSLTNAIIDTAGANAFSVIEAHNEYCGDICCTFKEPMPSSDTEIVSAVADLLATRASDSGSVSVPSFLWVFGPPAGTLSAQASSDFDLGALDGTWDTFVRAISGEIRTGVVAMCDDTIAGVESASEIGGFAVVLEVSRDNPANPTIVSLTATADLSWGFGSASDDEQLKLCGPVGPTSSCGIAVVVMVNAIAIGVDVGLESNGSPQIQQGVFAHFDDGSVIRLGFFTDEAFDDPNEGDDELFSVTGFSFDFDTSGSVASIELTASKDSFANFDGDLDDDDKVCRSDRVLLMDSLGSTIPSSSYIPRADFNLDGTIDATDLAAFNLLPCNADWTCDGKLDTFDFLAFQNDLVLEDPTADMDGNGTFDIFDVLIFQNSFVIGC